MAFLTRKRIKRFFLVFGLLLLVAAVALLSPVDHTPYQETAYYQQFRQEIASLPDPGPLAGSDTLLAGWARVNITPDHVMPTGGYGNRRGALYTSIHDSIWVRAFAFDNGIRKAALISADLLIIPPEVTKALAQRLPEIGLTIDQVYLCATHSHNSIGGWADKPVGSLLAGTYEPAIVAFLADRFIEAIKQAQSRQEKAAIGAVAYPSGELVENRLNASNPTDSLLRVMQIRQQSGATAIIASFSAHATTISDKDIVLSRDYPGALVDMLEKDPAIDFAAFCAGTVGSHRPELHGKDDWETIQKEAGALAQKITSGVATTPVAYQNQLRTVSVPLPLRDPHFRISENIRLRPWVFYALYGDYPSVLTGLRVGNILWLGTPCDFSGELTPLVQPFGQWSQHPLFITSFNGGYIGYVTPDAYYNWPKSETRDMNWFGPYNGAYLTEAMREVVTYLEK
jgi:hypothetical protein